MAKIPKVALLVETDLVNWELVSYYIERLDLGLAFRLEGGSVYGQGIWAPSIRYSADGKKFAPLGDPFTMVFHLTTSRAFALPCSTTTRPATLAAMPTSTTSLSTSRERRALNG